MLLIKNLNKISNKRVGDFQIDKIDIINKAYLFSLYKQNTPERLQIFLEREAKFSSITPSYELWCWDAKTQSCNKIMMNIERVKDMKKLIDTMMLLTRGIGTI